jgi:hypothetical protein
MFSYMRKFIFQKYRYGKNGTIMRIGGLSELMESVDLERHAKKTLAQFECNTVHKKSHKTYVPDLSPFVLKTLRVFLQ